MSLKGRGQQRLTGLDNGGIYRVTNLDAFVSAYASIYYGQQPGSNQFDAISISACTRVIYACFVGLPQGQTRIIRVLCGSFSGHFSRICRIGVYNICLR